MRLATRLLLDRLAEAERRIAELEASVEGLGLLLAEAQEKPTQAWKEGS